MINLLSKRRYIVTFVMCVCVILSVCLLTPIVHADNTTPTTETSETNPTATHECTWSEKKWTWTVDENGLASYVLHLKCEKCGSEETYTNKNKIYPSKSDKTFAPTCTKAGADFYSVEVYYDGQTFVGTYEKNIPATGHSYSKQESYKYDHETNSEGKQFHYFKCTNTNCPSNGKVEYKECSATGTNIAACEKQSVCDVCKKTFGEVLEHKYTNGVCEHCKKEHKPHEWENGICNGCKFEHKDHSWGFGECIVCKLKHDPHEWDNGQCSVCGFVSSEHQWKDGICEECKMEHIAHKWENGICSVCLLKHQHDRWSNGKCITCQIEHDAHEWKDGVCKICNFKHEQHQFTNNKCEVCDVVCNHKDFKDGACKTCGYTDYQVYIGSVHQYQLQSTGSIVLKTNAPSDTLKKVLVDGYPVDNRYVTAANKEITIVGEFLNRLSVGDHDVTLVYDNGEIKTSLTILDIPQKETKSNVWLIVVLVIVSIASLTGIALIIIYKIKNDREEESMAEKYARQHSNNNQQTSQKRPSHGTTEEEKRVIRRIEDEIGVNVSKFIDEEKNKD